MNEKYIRKLIRLVEESDIESLEVSSWGRKVRITQKLSPSSNGTSEQPAVLQPVVSAKDVEERQPAPPPTERAPQPPPPEEETGRLVAVKSPMVGTFYAAPSPDADPYVSLNEKVTVGQVVCIVEAMKLMNEIESEISGRVVKIMVDNAQPVEFGQELFLIDPAG
ncbi:MAG: acetyl-CoA carboxylase biotin carboxyl carrier protein [Candidatus Zixiibacteriota bacterium]|nr:MAG: acetyl-CoA carboxylase biotin carboxyl carrier protein [candidate division Zixibacteria bacterium]